MCNHTDTIELIEILHGILCTVQKKYNTIAIEIEVPCEVVPGITSALGAAASCQVHVGVEGCVVVVVVVATESS